MPVRIAHASIDERGKISGGKAGDQTGREVCVRSWYNPGWTVVIRATESTMRARIALAMERAADNPCIGYDQGGRNSLLKLVRGRGYDPAQATTACECDCSSLVVVSLLFAGIKESVLYRDGNSATTSTLYKALAGTGKFSAFTGERYCGSSFLLRRGDILLRPGHHVAVVLDDGGGVGMLLRGSSGPEVRELQQALNRHGAALGVDGYFGPITEAAVREYQRREGLEVDGVVGPETRRALGLA